MIEFGIALWLYLWAHLPCQEATYVQRFEPAVCEGILAPTEMMRDCVECWDTSKIVYQEYEKCKQALEEEPDCPEQPAFHWEDFLFFFGIGLLTGATIAGGLILTVNVL